MAKNAEMRQGTVRLHHGKAMRHSHRLLQEREHTTYKQIAPQLSLFYSGSWKRVISHIHSNHMSKPKVHWIGHLTTPPPVREYIHMSRQTDQPVDLVHCGSCKAIIKIHEIPLIYMKACGSYELLVEIVEMNPKC